MCKELSMLAGAAMVVVLTIGSAFLAEAGEDCQELTGESGFFYETIDSGGWLREYMLYVPPGYESNKATSLVFSFHGLGGGALLHLKRTRMHTMADEYNFILVAPYGVGKSWNAGGNRYPPAAQLGIDDVGFTSDMIEQISFEYCIDQDRIYATGMSNGGLMSWRLACDLGDRIAGIAPVAGAIAAPDCFQTARPVSVIAFHGTDDELIPYSGVSPDGVVHGGLPSVLFWAEGRGSWPGMCNDTTEVVYAEGDVTCFAYTECVEHGRVEFCTIEGGRHNWPGPDTTQDIDASRVIAEFFKKYPLPVISAHVDIDPWSERDFVYPFSRLFIPVALLGSDPFNVADAKVATLAFGPNGAPPAFDLTHPLVYWLAHRDVNGDGEKDLLSYFRTPETGIALGDTEACLTGETLGGTPFEGCDAITTLGGCGHGYELAFLVPPLMWVRGRRRISLAVPAPPARDARDGAGGL